MSQQNEGKEMQLTGGFDLKPKTLEDAMQFAKMMAESSLVPTCFKGKPGDVLIAVQMGADLGVPPMTAIQNIAVINGKPSIYGDLGKALLLKNGCKIEQWDAEEVKKHGKAWCKITRPDGRTIERTFSVEDAKTARLWGKEGPWSSYPYRQMSWRAFWFAARDVAADLLKGLAGAEEVQDYPEAVDTTIEMPKRLSETNGTGHTAEPVPTPAAEAAPAAEVPAPAPADPAIETATVTIDTITPIASHKGWYEIRDTEGAPYYATGEVAKTVTTLVKQTVKIGWKLENGKNKLVAAEKVEAQVA